MNLKTRIAEFGKSILQMKSDFIQTFDVNNTFFAVKRQVIVPVLRARAAPLVRSCCVTMWTGVSDFDACARRVICVGVRTSRGFWSMPVAVTM